MGIVQGILAFLRALLVGRAALAAENLALRHQIAVLHRTDAKEDADEMQEVTEQLPDASQGAPQVPQEVADGLHAPLLPEEAFPGNLP